MHKTTGNIAHLLSFARNEAAEETPAEFELPEDLSGLSDEELAALLETAESAFDGMRDSELSTEAIVALGDLADAIDTIREEQASRTAEGERLQAEADALAARVHGEAPAAEGETPAAEGETVEGETPAAEATGEAVTPEGETPPAEGAPAAAAATESTDGTPAPDAVTASGRTRRRISVPLGAIRDRAPAPVVDDGSNPVAIVASADIPGTAMGSRLSPLQLASAMHSRARNLGEGGQATVATISRPDLGEDLTLRERDTAEVQTQKMNAAREPEAMVAAGSWCTPSQFLYDLFGIEGSDGLVDLPTVNVERGGIQFVENGGPSIADVWAAPWLWTEANDITAAGNPHVDPEDDLTKPCVRVPCPEWVEERLDAHGICITHGNLADRAYPEMTRRFVDLVMAAHEHQMNTRKMAALVAASTAVPIAATFGAASALWSAVDLQAQDYRDKFRMDDGAVLETVFPRWVRGVIRADLSRRNGVDIRSITNAEIAAEFVNRQVRPQFIYDYQPLQTGAVGADGFINAWPDSVNFLMYAAGTFVLGTGGSIDLAVARDSTLNAVNDHTVAMTEEFMLVAKFGHESRNISVPLEPNGATGGQVAVAAILA